MTYFVVYYGLWLSMALLVGILTGFACLQKDETEDVRLLRRRDFIFVLCFLLFVAVVQVSLGRFALYSESAVFILAAFLVGAGLVVAFYGKISRDRIGWTIGAASVALIWVAANAATARHLEADLEHTLGSLIERAGGDARNFEVSGRDVFLPLDMPDRAALADRINRMAGVRLVWRVDALSPRAAEARARVIASAAARQAANRAAEAAWARARASSGAAVAALRGPEQIGAEQKEPGRGAKSRTAKSKAARDQVARDPVAEGRSANRPAVAALDTPAPAAPILWKTPLDPTLPAPDAPDDRKAPAPAEAPEVKANDDPSSCRTALTAVAASERIRFAVASAAVRDGAEPALDKLAALMKSCPDVTLEVGGHANSQGGIEENRNLSLRRAQSVADYLGRIGVERRRLSSVGYGAERPLVADDTPTSRAENRRVEFAVK